MKIKSAYILLAAAIPAITGAAGTLAQTGTGETDGYRLVWQDLFDSNELNPLRWEIEVNGDGGGNNELQFYTDRTENVRVGDDGQGNGCLILTARREAYNGKNFTSGRVISKNRVAFLHGKLEASIKLPSTANGLWPAFWMMGNDFDQVGWPACGETDILEMGHADGIKAGTQDRLFNGAMHWGSRWDKHAQHAMPATKRYSLQDGEFHLFTVIWDQDAVSMYVDLDKYPVQNPYFKMTIPVDDPGNEWSPGNYFHKENFILFNLAVGGDFPGIRNPEGITALNDANNHEASMMVNFVKIYQKGLPDESLYKNDDGDSTAGTDDRLALSPSLKVVGDTIISDKECDILVCDISGNVMLGQHGCHELSTDCLPKGIYIVNASDNIGAPSTLKMRK